MTARAFGPFLVTWTPAVAPPSVTVRLQVTGVDAWHAVLTPTAPTARLDATVATSRATGMILAVFAGSGGTGQLQGEGLDLEAPNFTLTFTGTIGTW